MVFTHTESEFILNVPEYEPEKIQTELLSLPVDVRFISSKKESDGKGGTNIHLWLYFSSSGIYSLSPIMVKTKSKVHYVNFEKITVSENPALVNPNLSVEFDSKNTIEAGESIFFTVYAQYAAQILDFSYKIPKDSIFFERELFFKSKDEKKRPFSNEKIPLARFEWKPLAEGTYSLPEIYIDAISYSGNRRTTYLPKDEISVKEGKISSDSSRNVLEDFYETQLPEEKNASDEIQQTDLQEECDELYELRSFERYGVPFTFEYRQNKNKRQNLEKLIGIPLSEDENNYCIMGIFFIVTGIFLMTFVFCLISKRYKTMILFFLLFVLSLSVSFVYDMEFSKRFGIFYGGRVFVIPENLPDSSGRLIPAGLRVKIIEKSSDWVYIETSDCSGWVKENLVKELN